MSDLEMGMSQFSENHQNTLKKLLAKIQDVENPQIIEIGSWLGQSTNVICNFMKNNKGGKLQVIDTFEGSPDTALVGIAERTNIFEKFVNNMIELGHFDRININRASSIEISELFGNESFDFIFIDGDHRYDFVSKDIALYYPKLKKGGIVCGHDYEGGGYNEEYINQDFVENKHHGVVKAVNEFFKGEAKQEFVFWWYQK